MTIKCIDNFIRGFFVMKKLAVLAAIVAVAALAAPAMSATNPFMDVPMNHWAYDAIGQLAAHGILSGFPDGLYKGGQQTTRYEMASALARSLAVVDMTKASKQDVEMLKKLVVEFKDELEALGVRVDELDERVALLESRLGGWHIHGSLVLDLTYKNGEKIENGNPYKGGDPSGKGNVKFDNARLYFERTFGENDEYFFRARLRNDHDGMGNRSTNSAYFDRYYVTMPFFFDTRLTVGRFLYDVDTAYRPSVANTGSWTDGDSVLTDTSELGFALEKNFGLGNFLAYVSHTNRIPGTKYNLTKTYTDGTEETTYGYEPFGTVNKSAWTFFLMGNLQFTENFGLDIGGQAFVGDNSSSVPSLDGNTLRDPINDWVNTPGDVNFKNLWTVFAGLRFNFNDAIAIKGSFYHQKASSERVVEDATARNGARWSDFGFGIPDGNGWADSANHWRAIIDVKQEALKFTSLWLEYGQYDRGFWTPQGMSTIFPSESVVLKPFVGWGEQLVGDLKYWRVVLGQEWNEKWATHLFYYGYKFETGTEDYKPTEFGVGVQYKLNDATTMGLNYVHVGSDRDESMTSINDKDDIIRFRTSINF